MESNLVLHCDRCNRDYCHNDFEGHRCMLVDGLHIQEEDYITADPNVITTGNESADIVIATILMMLIFSWNTYSSVEFTKALAIAVAPAFILHELAHKFVAQSYDRVARFVMNKFGLVVSLFITVSLFPVAMVGYTTVLGRLEKKEGALISAAGPTTNLIISLLSLLGTVFSVGFLLLVFQVSIMLNSFLAVFNLIPLSSFDGKKLIQWNWMVWLLLFLPNLVLMIASLELIL